MTERISTLTRTLAAYVQAEPRSLQAMEEQIVRVLHDLGHAVLTALVPRAAPVRPAPDLDCPCGPLAPYQRLRPATITTRLGRRTCTRAVYRCAACGHGHAPFDIQRPVAAGGLSAGLNEALALLGATQDSFAQASAVLARLCLVQVCPNSARAATADLGSELAPHAEQVVAIAQQPHPAPPQARPAPPRRSLRMDGGLAHIHDAGWNELTTGGVSTTRTRVSRKRPDKGELRAEQQRYLAALTEAAPFGWHRWAEAGRGGPRPEREVVVLGDGAHWIWNVAERHFPHATPILDWQHASESGWNAATAIFGAARAGRRDWAKLQRDAVWDGQVAQVLAAREPQRRTGEVVSAAISQYTTHQARMDYPAYRARGLQIGSGTIESACKQLVSTRLKLAGMLWDADGAEAVAVGRAWLKSERWDEAMRMRPPLQRTYRRQTTARSAAAAAV